MRASKSDVADRLGRRATAASLPGGSSGRRARAAIDDRERTPQRVASEPAIATGALTIDPLGVLELDPEALSRLGHLAGDLLGAGLRLGAERVGVLAGELLAVAPRGRSRSSTKASSSSS